MKDILKMLPVFCIVVLIAGCGAIEGYKYMCTGKEGVPPPRTIQAAQAQFNDGNLLIGQSSEANLKTLLGSPAEIKKVGGKKVYFYMKNVSTQGVSAEAGTTYIASYTFNKTGKLLDKDYAARPMGNPLTGH